MRNRIALAAVGLLLSACGSGGDQTKDVRVDEGRAANSERSEGKANQFSTSTDILMIGQIVLAKRHDDDWYYPAKVISKDSERFYLEYRAGGSAWIGREDIQIDSLAAGSRVYCNWKNYGTYYPGVIKSRNGENISIDYDDGDFEETNIGCLRLGDVEQKYKASPSSKKIANSNSSENRILNLPKLALACGGGGYRNGRLVFDPARGRIYKGSVSQKGDGSGSKWESSFIRKDGNVWYILFKGSLDYPTREVYFDSSRLTLKENSNYEPGGKEKSDACYARIERVKRECATAGDIDRCMEIRDRTAWANEFSGACSIKAPRWQDFQCDNITSQYDNALQQARAFSLFNF